MRCIDCLHHADEADQSHVSDGNLPVYSKVMQAQPLPQLAELRMHDQSANGPCPAMHFYPWFVYIETRVSL